MLILLPPSEGKATPVAGAPVDLSTLSLPELNPLREQVLDSLVALCTRPDAGHALSVLGLAPGQLDEVLHNAALRRSAAAPAGRLYTGVLYEALDLASLSRTAYRFAQRSVLVFSALWGAVRLGDRIPHYRCSTAVKLPGLDGRTGGLGSHWRRAMPSAMVPVAGRGPVLDLRSTGYAATWTPKGDIADRTVAVRVLHERMVGGVARRSVVSHFNKATKGRLVRSLAMAGATPRTRADLVATLRELKYTVEEHQPVAGRPLQLDVIVVAL